jgi:hypothetical protein
VIAGFVLTGTVLVVGGTVGTLWAMGVPMPWQRKVARSLEGLVAVPVSGVKVPAYTKVTRDHFANQKTGAFSVVHLRPEEVRPDVLTDLSKIVGRVLANDKPAGYAFTERDFLPEGTRPGVVAGVPPGKWAYTLDATKVQGIHALRAGDHVDILASLPLDDKQKGASSQILNAPIAARTKQAVIRVLVDDGVIAVPVTTRKPPGGAKAKGGDISEVVIACDPEELPALSEAVAIDATLICVARSGRPGAENAKTELKGKTPPEPTTIEVIVGGKRKVLAFHFGEELPTVKSTNDPDAQPASEASKSPGGD